MGEGVQEGAGRVTLRGVSLSDAAGAPEQCRPPQELWLPRDFQNIPHLSS